MTSATTALAAARRATPLNRQQILGFWAAWSGWMLDGMDAVIFALVLSPALHELLPKSGVEATAGNVAMTGSILFALFLAGWGMSFIWGPVADRFGRTRALAATILVFSVFTGAAALSENVWQLGLFRFLAGIGIGGEWAMAGTYVAESWPEDRRKMGAGYLQTGVYFGFFVAAGLNYTVGAEFGWRIMFLCGMSPVVVALFTLFHVKEPVKFHVRPTGKWFAPLQRIFSAHYRRRTIVNSVLLTVCIIGLWAAAVYEPIAIVTLARKAGMDAVEAGKMASFGTGVLSIGTILGCLAAPLLSEWLGRRKALSIFFVGMMGMIVLCFGWLFYQPDALNPFIVALFFMGVAGGSFTVFSLWLPEQYDTSVRASAFAFCTSFGRMVGAFVNFGIGALIKEMDTLGTPLALTAVAFAIGLCVIPFGHETHGEVLPE